MIVVAGATGALGKGVVKYLAKQKAEVKALVRFHSDVNAISLLRDWGAIIAPVDEQNTSSLVKELKGATCVVSAVSGLHEVIVGFQTRLMEAASEAGVPKFIPSDYCIDYTKLPSGNNRNLDYRKEFKEIIDKSTLKTTSVLNGMFTDLLLDKAPVILPAISRVLCWGNPDQKMDFTTMEDTAKYTSFVALEERTPRFLKVAGSVASSRDLAATASEVYSKEFKILRPGGLKAFQKLIGVTKFFSPASGEVFPAWQGMQYLYDMLSGAPKLDKLDNDRYGIIDWTSVKEVLRESKEDQL